MAAEDALVDFLTEGGGQVHTEELRPLCNDLPWLKLEVGPLSVFCQASSVLDYAPSGMRHARRSSRCGGSEQDAMLCGRGVRVRGRRGREARGRGAAALESCGVSRSKRRTSRRSEPSTVWVPNREQSRGLPLHRRGNTYPFHEHPCGNVCDNNCKNCPLRPHWAGIEDGLAGVARQCFLGERNGRRRQACPWHGARSVWRVDTKALCARIA